MPKKISHFEKEQNPEVSAELIKGVEQSKLSPDDKVNFLLTKAGLKPASDIELDIRTFIHKQDGSLAEERQHFDEERIDKIISLIKESGLAYKVQQRRIDKSAGEYVYGENIEITKDTLAYTDVERLEILIGHSTAELNALIEAIENGDDELIGRAYGYPRTAVEAYVGKRKRIKLETEEALPRETRDTLRFLNAVPSEDNWREELKIARRNADFIKQVSPTIYQEIAAEVTS